MVRRVEHGSQGRVMNSYDAKRADELATKESLEVLSSALFQALEADLSDVRWPRLSKAYFMQAESIVHRLISFVK